MAVLCHVTIHHASLVCQALRYDSVRLDQLIVIVSENSLRYVYMMQSIFIHTHTILASC